jgi:hypothetical protein
MYIALAAGLAQASLNSVQAATINAATSAFADVSAAVALASDGDTVIVPAGTASWTSSLTIKKGITLQGATTVSGDHNTQLAGTPMAANDQTVIRNNVPLVNGNNVLVSVTLTPAQSFRMTGFTFQSGTTGTSNVGALVIFGSGTSAVQNVRVDHCHTAIAGLTLTFLGWCYGVVDHCIFDFSSQGQHYVEMSSYGGGSNTQGDGSWADGPNYGTNKFVFFEDNTFNNKDDAVASGTIDGIPGGRIVQRYNVLNGVILSGGHGTETTARGVRVREEYGNVIYPSTSAGNWGGIMRSGSAMIYNNTWVTSNANLVGGKSLQNYRSFWHYGTWDGISVVPNPWDIWDTEGNGTYVSGHSPHLYDSGTQTGSTNTVLTDSTKTWTTNQWHNFTAFNAVTLAPGMTSSNTSNGITYALYNDSGGPTKFNNGDSYRIYKALVLLDGVGRGSGDLVTRVSGVWGNPINSVSGKKSWPRNHLEPCYSWDSFNGVPVKMGASSDQGVSLAENREYFNWNSTWKPGNSVATGIAVGTHAQRMSGAGGTAVGCTPGNDITGVTASPPGVGFWETDTNTLYVCTAPNTWTQYYQPYVYPHPLVSGTPNTPSNLHIVP